jgi:hypothetical protein
MQTRTGDGDTVRQKIFYTADIETVIETVIEAASAIAIANIAMDIRDDTESVQGRGPAHPNDNHEPPRALALLPARKHPSRHNKTHTTPKLPAKVRRRRKRNQISPTRAVSPQNLTP